MWLEAWLLFDEYEACVPQNMVMKKLCGFITDSNRLDAPAMTESDVRFLNDQIALKPEGSESSEILHQFTMDALLSEMCRSPRGPWMKISQGYAGRAVFFYRSIEILSRTSANPNETSIDALFNGFQQRQKERPIHDGVLGQASKLELGTFVEKKQEEWESSGGVWLLKHNTTGQGTGPIV